MKPVPPRRGTGNGNMFRLYCHMVGHRGTIVRYEDLMTLCGFSLDAETWHTNLHRVMAMISKLKHNRWLDKLIVIQNVRHIGYILHVRT